MSPIAFQPRRLMITASGIAAWDYCPRLAGTLFKQNVGKE